MVLHKMVDTGKLAPTYIDLTLFVVILRFGLLITTNMIGFVSKNISTKFKSKKLKIFYSWIHLFVVY